LFSFRNARVSFGVVLAAWLLFPIAARHQIAQDAVPMVVASRLSVREPDSVYPRAGGIGSPNPRFKALSCEYFGDLDACATFAVSFISPPTALPLLRPLPDSGSGASLVFRLFGAACLAAAMTTLWRKVVRGEALAAWSMVLAASLLLPFATFMMGLGQTSPLLVLAAAMSIGAATRSRAAAWRLGGVLAVAGAFKVFPLLMLGVPISRRHWRVVGYTTACLACLAAVAAMLAPTSLWGDFVATVRSMQRGAADNRYNSSLEASLHELGVAPVALAWVVRAAVVALLVACRRRLRDLEVRWAIAWVAMLVLLPQIWGHYSMVAFAAVALMVAHTTRPRFMLALPLSAALLLPVALLEPAAHGAVTVRLIVNLAEFALVLVLALMIPTTGADRST
jgi:hypothetical protein